MTSDWSRFKDIKGNSSSIFKPENGVPYKVRVIGEPWVYTSDYNGQISTRFAVAVYNQTQGEAQLLMLPKTAFGTLFDLKENEEWGDPDQYDVTVKRTGSGTDTEWSIQPSPKTPLADNKREEVEAIMIGEVLERLPSVQQSFPISELDPEQLKPAKKSYAASESELNESDPEMPADFLQ